MTSDTPASAGPADGDGHDPDDRLTAPVDGSDPPRLPFAVVGVGASAGGLEAYSELLDATPADTGMAFVLVQHLPPDRESLLVEILARHTPMPVLQVEDGQRVEPNHVYVIRPGHTLTIRGGRLHLGEIVTKPGHGRPVDDFFRSLAEEQRERAIAVILSGMGSNGSAGAEAVKAVGGLCVAQDPESAKYPSMPRSLIDNNLADFVLRPAEMPGVLARYAGHPYAAGGGSRAEALARRDAHALAEIMIVLRTRTRHDFGGYRKPTIVRRVQRRMGLHQIATLGEYARAVRQSAAEARALADDLLIHVTGFFRDPEAWDAFRDKVIGPLVADRADGQPIRAWVTACATGEEAYTLAMLLVEAAEGQGKQFDIKVFATDMAERSLAHARAGVFPGGVETEIAADRLERFFDRDDVNYRVKKQLRELVVFAPQNVLQDPPFSRLDVVTCRNLLIYLEPEVQRRVISLLHFSLREGGALMLGTSETVGAPDDEFTPIDKKWQIYRRVGPTRHGSVEFPRPARLHRDDPGESARTLPQATVAQLANRALLDHFTPAAVVADRNGEIIYFHGPTDRYLDQPRGEPSRDLLALAKEQVRGAVRTAMSQAIGHNDTVAVRDGLIDLGDGPRRVHVHVTPLGHRVGQAVYLVSFTDHPESPPPPPPPADDGPGQHQLIHELQRVRDELQSTLEEMQTSNEEMKASNEEVTSVNEELQSTNEELETSKEELQSLNEELTTVNAQLQAKMEELERTSSDLASLLSSTDIAVLFLDQQFRIRRYTPAVRDLIDMIPGDAGRPLADLRRKFADPDLVPDAQAVLARLVPIEREVGSDAGLWYVRRVLPYRTTDNRIDGVVVTFVDITRRRAAEEAVRSSEGRYQALVADLPGGAVFVVGRDLRYQLAGGEALRATGFAPAALEGKTVRELLSPDLAATHEADYRRALAGQSFRSEHPAYGRHYLTHGSPLRGADGAVYAVLVVSYDITEQKATEEALRQARDNLEVQMAERTAELAAEAKVRERAEAARVALLRRLVTAQEAERRRLARDLHDQIGQTLTALTLAARAARDAGPLPPEATARLADVQRLAEELGRDAHALAVRLRPTALDDLGLEAAVGQLVADWSARAGVAADFQPAGGEAGRLPPEVETALYRVVQEALTNVARHAKAGHVSVVVERVDGQAVAVVEDDGAGFAPDAVGPDRIGLVGMRERVALAGGTLDVESGPGRGTTVIARIPVRPPGGGRRWLRPSCGCSWPTTTRSSGAD